MTNRLKNKVIFILGAVAGAIIGYMTIEYVIKPLRARAEGN